MDSFVDTIRGEFPLVLLAGQGTGSSATANDKLVAMLRERFGGSGEPSNAKRTFDEVFELAIDDKNSAVSWAADKESKLPWPEKLDTVSSLPWAAVYTSSIDTALSRSFRRDWRVVTPILNAELSPSDPRSQTNLHVTYLYGRIDRPVGSDQPPFSKAEYAIRQGLASVLLSRLPEIVSAMGLVVIDGYSPEDDWLEFAQLYAVLAMLGKNQVHWYGFDHEWGSSDLVQNLISKQVLVTHTVQFCDVVEDAFASGYLKRELRPRELATGRALTLGDRLVEIPRSLWARISAIGQVVGDQPFENVQMISVDELYRQFKEFLGDPLIRPPWTAYSRNLPFKRDYLKGLEVVVDRAKTRRRISNAVILHGQSGSGRSTSLAQLAFDLRKMNRWPVLFIPPGLFYPNEMDVDEFCQWCEENNAPVTVIVWDGDKEPSSYHGLASSLASRGRRAIVIGSSYRIEDSSVTGRDCVEATAAMSESEVNQFTSHLESIDKDMAAEIDQFAFSSDPFFLVSLYRWLPETRYNIIQGLRTEVAYVETVLADRGRSPAAIVDETALGLALKSAGLVRETSLLDDNSRSVGEDQWSPAELLVAYVMVIGWLGLGIPIELLMRTLGGGSVVDVPRLFHDIDLFRWAQDSDGNILVLPRHKLEAEIVKNRFGGKREEKNLALAVLSQIKADSDEKSVEVQFAIDLAHALGPNGPARHRFADYYVEISNCLKRLRTDKSIENTYLMLQEATLLREYTRSQSRSDSPDENIEAILDSAADTLIQALDTIEARGTSQQRHRSRLSVELASTLGYLANIEIIKGHARESMALYQRARERLLDASRLAPDSQFPLDVRIWTGRDLLYAEGWSEEQRLELKADLLDSIGSQDEETLDFDGLERFQRRRQEVGDILEETSIKEDAFRRLIESGSTAGILLEANRLARNALEAEQLSNEGIKAIEAAISFCQDHMDLVRTDPRCLRFYLRLWWAEHTGGLIWRGERNRLPGKREELRECIDIVDRICALQPQARNPQMLYLLAVCNWQLLDYDTARALWSQLQRESDFVTGYRRILKNHIVTDETGKPTLFHGQIHALPAEHTVGRVFVEQINQIVAFIPRDFGLRSPRIGDSVEPFHLAFNFIGPIADPRKHYGVTSRSET